MKAEEVRRLVLKRKGAWKLLYPPFWLLSKLYCRVAALRNWLYDSGFFNQTSFPLPVISVGNIVAGGSGKTPLTESIYLLLEEAGFSPAIVCKGYKGSFNGVGFAEPNPEKFGDEAALYALKKYITVVSRDKIKGIKFAFKNGFNAVVLDDGFQYRKVIPQLNIVAVDPFNPFGDSHCLPLGLLREPLEGLKRADCFVITRANIAPKERIESLELYLKTFKKPIFRAEQTFKYWINQNFERTTPPEKEIDVFCGIGNPGQFIEMLIKMGFTIKNVLVFSDHHFYTEKDIKKILKLKNPVTTEKDLIKLKGTSVVAKAPVLRLDAFGLKEFILSNIENTERSIEEVEGFSPAGISTFETRSLNHQES